jgi:hypothetical protein
MHILHRPSKIKMDTAIFIKKKYVLQRTVIYIQKMSNALKEEYKVNETSIINYIIDTKNHSH